MGTSNELLCDAECPKCHVTGPFEIQFKFGERWQHRYKLADVIRWGALDVGERNLKSVLVRGIAGHCHHCAADYLCFHILLEHDQLMKVLPLEERPPEKFIVLER